MPTLIEQLGYAELDLATLAEVTMNNYSADTTLNRTGSTLDTLSGAIKKLGYQPPVAYAGSISFLAGDFTKTFERNNIVYAPLPSALPFTTTGTWNASDELKVFIVQIGSIASIDADNVSYDNTASGLTATDVQAAIDELETTDDAQQNDIDNLVTLTGVAVDSTTMGTFTGTTIPDNSDIKECLQALETQVELASIQAVVSPLTFTVGSLVASPPADFGSLGAALEYVSKTYIPTMVDGTFTQPRITINLEAGYQWNEQIFIDGVDLSFVTVTGTDATTTILRSALTTVYRSLYYYAMVVTNGATAPVFDQRFVMDTSGTASNRQGFLVEKGSTIIFKGSAGLDSSTGTALRVDYASTAVCDLCSFQNGESGIEALNASRVSAKNVDVSGNSTYGIASYSGSSIDAASADASGCGYGVWAANGDVYFGAGTATGYVNNGIYAYGGQIYAVSASCRKAGVNTAADIVVSNGGIIRCHSSTGGTTPATKNAISTNGIIFG